MNEIRKSKHCQNEQMGRAHIPNRRFPSRYERELGNPDSFPPLRWTRECEHRESEVQAVRVPTEPWRGQNWSRHEKGEKAHMDAKYVNVYPLRL
jgi:hypothetical protein